MPAQYPSCWFQTKCCAIKRQIKSSRQLKKTAEAFTSSARLTSPGKSCSISAGLLLYYDTNSNKPVFCSMHIKIAPSFLFMMRFAKRTTYLRAENFVHMQDEFHRHLSASAISTSFLTLFSFPVILVDRMETISFSAIAASAAVFVLFSFLPDVLRFFSDVLGINSLNRLSHSFKGALLFSGIFMLAILPLDVPKITLFALSFLGYLLHLFVDSIESAVEWWVGGMERVLSSQPFASLRKNKTGLYRAR